MPIERLRISFNSLFRSTLPEVLFWKTLLKSIAKFVAKHLRWSLHLSQIFGLDSAILLTEGAMACVFF